MRVSTSMIYNAGLRGIMTLQSELYKTQNQLSTGRRILTPADDPIGASEALEISQSKEINTQFLENQADARVQLTFSEQVVGGVGERLTRIMEQAAEAGNLMKTPAERGMIAAELKLNLESIIGFANSQDGTGKYLFSGNTSTTEPFETNPVNPPAPFDLANRYVNYQGDAGNPTLQVTASKTMPVAMNGIEVFMQVKDAQGNVTGQSMFDSIKNLIEIVDPSGAIGFSTTALDAAREELQSSLDHVANIRATLGARLNALDGLTTTGSDIDYLYDVRLSEIEDLDYTEAISRFTRFQTQLEATQLTFKQTGQLSLFNIL